MILTKNKISSLFRSSGLVLGLIRLPLKGAKVCLDKLTTTFYRCFLNKAGRGLYIEFGVNILRPGSVSLGDNVFIGKGTRITDELGNGELLVSDNVEIGRDCAIDATGTIVLASSVLLSRGVRVYSHSHGYDPRSVPNARSICIESNVWIGTEAVILESCSRISQGSIIGARSVVTKRVGSPYSILVGSPATIIGKVD